MWVFLTARARQWFIMVVLAPVALFGLRLVRRQVDKRGGPPVLSRGLLGLESFTNMLAGRRRTSGGRTSRPA